MKMRFKRRMRTKPREYNLVTSIKVAPHMVALGRLEFPIDTRRVRFSFFMQYATHKDCMRKIKEVVEAMSRSPS